MAKRLLFFTLLALALGLSVELAGRHTWRLDVTAQQTNTLSPAAAQALDNLPAALEVAAYVPDFAVQRAEIERLFEVYRQHRADTRLQFIDPVARPDLARSAGVDTHGELHLRSGQRQEVVKRASAQAIDAALNRLARRGERWIVSLRGHGEAEPDASPGGLGSLVDALEARGYGVVALDPRQLDRFPDNTAVVLAAAPMDAYDEHSQQLLRAYLDTGGALFWLADQTLPSLGEAPAALGHLPGVVVDAAAARYGLKSPDNAIVDSYPEVLGTALSGHSVLPQAHALHWDDGAGWRLVGRLRNSAQSWNETGALRGDVARDPSQGEQAGPHTVGLLLQRDGGASAARVAIIASAGFAANSQIGRGANLALAVAVINWLSGNDRLAAPAAATDLEFTWSAHTGAVLAIVAMALLPAAYLAIGLWIRARRRRA